MNVSRMCANGKINPDETLNKSQVYVTTAGWKNTYPYDKLIQILIWQIVKPGHSIALGGTWRVPVLMKLLDRNFLKELKMDGEHKVSAVKKLFLCARRGLVIG